MMQSPFVVFIIAHPVCVLFSFPRYPTLAPLFLLLFALLLLISARDVDFACWQSAHRCCVIISFCLRVSFQKKRVLETPILVVCSNVAFVPVQQVSQTACFQVAS
jgi:hypothetical protein